jgi:ABC-type multidrug transport system fused ATPase/permease subunit
MLNKVENVYITILRLVVLTGATLALVSAIILGFSAANKLLSFKPKDAPPPLLTPQNTPKLDVFLVSNTQKIHAPENSVNKNESEDRINNPDLDASVRNISQYIREVFHINLESEEIRERFLIKNANLLPKQTQNAYFKSVNEFSSELLNKAAEQKALVAVAQAAGQPPSSAPGFINFEAALQWQLSQFAKIIDKNNDVVTRNQQERISAKAAGIQELYIAMGSFVAFLFIIFLFIIIKIERNLRGISVIKAS